MPTSAAAIYFLFGCVFYYFYEGNIVCESALAKNESASFRVEQISRRPLHASELFSNIYTRAYFTSNLGIPLVSKLPYGTGI